MQPEFTWRGSIPVAYTPPAQEAPRPVVLIVTSDDDLRAASARALTDAGYAVLTASHGGHALLACLSADRGVDLLAAELSMDDMSGPALASRLRRICPSMRTVYFASAGTHECEGLLVRPFTRDDLMASLALAREPRRADATLES